MSTATTRHTGGASRPSVSADRSRPRTHALLLVVLGLCLAVSGVPSALYGTYAAQWHFSSLTTTVVFAVYAVCALIGLTVAGPLTDSRGRRPVLLASALLMLVGLAIFMTAHDVAELLVARAVHGFAIGGAVVAAGAALLDIRPGDGARSGRLSGIAFSIGMGAGILGSGLVAQYLPHPLVLPYAITAGLVVALLVGLAVMPETHSAATRARVRLARPSVPSQISGDFSFAVLGAAASWVVLGLYLSLFPGLDSAQTGIHGVVFGGAVIAALTASSALAQALAHGVTARRLAIIGDLGMAVTMLLTVPALLSGRASLVVAAAVPLGVFFGMAFSGSLRHLSEVIPPESRGGVMAAFYLLCYSAMAVPAVLAGLAATRWSLAQTYAGFAVAVALVCAAAGIAGSLAGRARTPQGVPVSADVQP